MQSEMTWKKMRYGYLFMAPWFVGFLVFNLIPLTYSLFLSMTRYDIFTPPQFRGLENYIRLLSSDLRFRKALSVTFTYVALGVPLQLFFSLVLALALNRGLPGLPFFRAVYYLPALLGGSVAIAILWRQIFGIEGIINQLLAQAGIGTEYLRSWVTHPRYAIYTLVLLRVWQFGSPMVIFLAGLKQIPAELYEAAEIDGAGKGRQFFLITAPMLTPIIFFNLVMQIVSSFQAFTPAYIVGGATGGAMDGLLFYTLYLYIRGFTDFQMGIASALAWILMAIIGGLAAILFITSDRWVYYEK